MTVSDGLLVPNIHSLVVSVLRDDWMIGVVGILILSVGNAALMLLAQIMKRLSAVMDGEG